MRMHKKPFGTLPDGRTAHLYTLENDNGMSATVCDYGGIVTHLLVPNRLGQQADVVLGHADLEGYLENPASFGALIGRNANRLSGAKLPIFGKVHELPDTGGGANSHGGPRGLSRRLWEADFLTTAEGPALDLRITVPDMDDGFPGTLNVTARYSLTDHNALLLEYAAATDRDTIVNLTNHSYFNLSGHASGTVHDQLLQLSGDFFAVPGADGPAGGEVRHVQNTPMDFREAKPIGRDIAVECPGKSAAGYNHHMMLSGSGYRRFATLTDPGSGRVMHAYTDLPGVMLFTGNHLPTKLPSKDGAVYVRHQGVALETQYCPNSPHQPWLLSPILRAGGEYRAKTAYQFGVL